MALCGNIPTCPGVTLPKKELPFFQLGQQPPITWKPLTIYVFNYLSILTLTYCLRNAPLGAELSVLSRFALN